ncbi:MAG TPA: hypothetical protein ENJ95_01175 [Bacteroidetes bacterium]|nr:hypothetical protein [Bacteroidota bacterium]
MKIAQTFLLLLLLASFFTACQQANQAAGANPPAPGFNAEGSDAKAIAIADEVMAAMGGRQAWDESRYFSWNFFGRRRLVWDKKTGDVRIESFADSITYLLNVNTLKGKVKVKDAEITDPEVLKTLLKKGKSIWINDSYWLVMPFKLKDSGVTLVYKGEEKTEDGQPADVLQLTFQNVGDTPDNKYEVFVDKKSRLVTQWSYFKDARQEIPNFTVPWKGYRQYGKILLSGDRGKRKLTDISVDEQVPASTFSEF